MRTARCSVASSRRALQDAFVHCFPRTVACNLGFAVILHVLLSTAELQHVIDSTKPRSAPAELLAEGLTRKWPWGPSGAKGIAHSSLRLPSRLYSR
ncbi:hypothetical protein EXIGLDRAFT_717695 [Exidia glandulosa HHB12029]|uniref:Uncharacterized protein n=1 Tax=Exidia glandulosa HHB12029 TaxID=1314781 RepID=A0A166MN19_EXIGL|nr:hypothetical protein EXIGLDRAFT_717695 [Exidia glandulosa HHB12029]